MRLTFPVAAAIAAALVFVDAADAGLLVAAFNSHSVASYADDGAYLGDFVTSGSGGLSGPEGLVIGPDGNLYVSSLNNSQILRFNGTTGAFIDVFASGGTFLPQGLVFGPDGNLYVAGGGSHNVARYNGVTGEFIDNFVAPNSGGLEEADGIGFGADGNLYVAGSISKQIHRYDGATGAPLGSVVLGFGPSGFAIGPDGDLFIAKGRDIVRFDGLTGADEGVFASRDSYGFLDVEFGADGILYASDYSVGGKIVRFDATTGAFIDEMAVAQNGPTYLLHRNEASAVPEPASLTLFGLGALGLAIHRKRRSTHMTERRDS
jgi:outer membrane protein assembly factor BamB